MKNYLYYCPYCGITPTRQSKPLCPRCGGRMLIDDQTKHPLERQPDLDWVIKNRSVKDEIEYLKSLQEKEWNSIREGQIIELERKLK